LRTIENQSIKIELTDLTVEDPDDWFYPFGFTMKLYPGDNYSVSGNVITPKPYFYGELRVPVTVNDGKDDSDLYNLKITVEGSNDAPVITGQQPVVIKEDASFTIGFSHLQVSDPDNNYPTGFSLILSQGANYTLNDKTIAPEQNFNGTLQIIVKVSDGSKTSEPFNFQITVAPVNDPPIIAISGDTLFVKPGISYSLIDNVSITDVDNDFLSIAEVGFATDNYQPGKDILSFSSSDTIKGAFDAQHGVLAMIGKASIRAYANALKSVMLQLQNSSNAEKSVYIIVNDGEANSNRVEHQVKVSSKSISLQIPTAFTPNGDSVNDTWTVSAISNDADSTNAVIRVYTKTGQIVFEGKGLGKEWDGHYHGAALPADVYYYTVSFTSDNNRSPVRGIVTILR
jgi:gliding motility-associated-like protein